MSTTHSILTRYGPVTVRLHRRDDGWLPVLVGRHLVPAQPKLDGPVARSEQDALTMIAQAIDRTWSA